VETALKDDDQYKTYFKMLRLGIPVSAVKHKMTRDGLDPTILDLDHNKSVKSQVWRKRSIQDDPTYATYFKMISMGVPVGSVRHRMLRDGLDPAIIETQHSKPMKAKWTKTC